MSIRGLAPSGILKAVMVGAWGLVAACAQPPIASPPPPPEVPLAIGNYRYAWSGMRYSDGAIRHVIAARDVDSAQVNTALDLVPADGGAPVPLIGRSAALMTVRVSSRAPEAVMFLDRMTQETSLGTLMYADLSKSPPVVKGVPGGSRSPARSAAFGPSGASLLFFADFDVQKQTGLVLWSRGTTNPVDIGQNGDPGSVVLSRDRIFAVVGVNTSIATGMGDLVRVNMETGQTHPVAQGVILRARAYAGQDTRLKYASDHAFSVASDASAVAYVDSSHSVKLWRAGSETVTVAAEGRFPAVSSNGRTVVYYEGRDLVVWTDGAVVTRTRAYAGQLTPRISPDNRFVAFLTEFRLRGYNGYFGMALGDVSVMRLDGSQGAVEWGRNVAWYSTAFGARAGEKLTLSMLANCRDLTGAATLDNAIADFVVGDPSGWPPAPLSREVAPFLEPLRHSGGWAFLATDHVFTPDVAFRASVWDVTTGQVQTLSEKTVFGTLRSGADIPPMEDGSRPFADHLVYLSPESRNPSFEEIGYSLWGARPGHEPAKLQERVLEALPANDGRVISIQAVGNNGETQVHILPFPH